MNKILCIVVTYNRINDLKTCISSLHKQTYTDFDILVVNNGSTDGTYEYLSTLPNVKTINQQNLGGAGGFYTGMKYGFEHNYQWLWLMDDDGIPDTKQLQELIKYKDTSWYLNALVLDKDNNSNFAFPSDDSHIKLDEIRKLPTTEQIVHPFNGTFYNIELVKKIGFIKREMFIWGDEKEYTFRAIRYGIKPITITSAIHYHPKEKGIKKNALPWYHSKRTTIILKPEKLSHFYYRNLGFIDANYRSILKSIKQVLIHTIYFLRKGKFQELSKFLKFYLRGRNNNFQ